LRCSSESEVKSGEVVVGSVLVSLEAELSAISAFEVDRVFSEVRWRFSGGAELEFDGGERGAGVVVDGPGGVLCWTVSFLLTTIIFR
jgi:hypothetical protein